MEIDEASKITTAHPLNCDISFTELNAFISRWKSNAIGLDLIHNDMLLHLSSENRQMLYVFNLIWSNGYPFSLETSNRHTYLQTPKTALPYLIVWSYFLNLLPSKTFLTYCDL